jgi:ABC-type lipoprotein export system ATPase subunit
VIIVTHDPNVASIAKKMIFIRDGTIIGEKVL